MQKTTLAAAIGTSVLALVLVSCGGGDDNDDDAEAAGDFVVEVIDYRAKNQTSRSYEVLHPNQQAVVPADVYGECRITIPPVTVEVDEIYTEPWSAPEVPEADTYAVTVKLTAGESESFSTMHVYTVDGEFRWVMGEEDIAAYQAGTCP